MKRIVFGIMVLMSYEILLQSSAPVSLSVSQVATQFTKLFERAIRGDSDALYKIRIEAKKALGLSNEEKRKILKALEKALDAAVEEKFQEMKDEHDKIEKRKTQLDQESEKLDQEGKKGSLARFFSGSMSPEAIAQKQEAIDQERERLDQRATKISAETMKDISDISIPSRQIIDELAPMLDTKSQHLVASYDRTPYHDRVSLIDIRDFNLDDMPSDQTVDTYVRNQISELAKEGKVSVPKHRESREPFSRKVVSKVIDLHSVGKRVDDLPAEVKTHIDLYTSDLARKAFEASDSKSKTFSYKEMTKAYQDIQSVANPDIRAMTHEKILQLHDAQEARNRQMIERQQDQSRELIQRQSRSEDVAVVRGL